MQSPATAKHSTLLGVHHLTLYSRALHPELFTLKTRRQGTLGACEFEAWLMQSGHALRFQVKGACASELVTAQESGLPVKGATATFACVGEREYEHYFPDCKVKYTTTMQTETLSENLYRATFNDLVALAAETDALLHRWIEPDGQALSMVEIYRYPSEVHFQASHMAPATGLVLRTQSIFELVK